MAIPSIVSFFPVVETLFDGFGLLDLLMAISFLFCNYCQVYDLANDLFCYVSYFGGDNNLLNFFKALIVRV